MVMIVAIPVRFIYGLGSIVITDRILDNCAKLMLATGWIVTYGYIVEHFGAYYSGEAAERSLMFGHHPHSVAFWLMISCNSLIPQVLWLRRVRRNRLLLLVVSLFVLLGMWFERYVIIVQGLLRDQLPSVLRPRSSISESCSGRSVCLACCS